MAKPDFLTINIEKTVKEVMTKHEDLIYLKHVYNIVRLDTEGMDSIYGDYIKQMVGVYGLNALIEHKLVESCGVINGRKLYVLCEKRDETTD